MSSTSTLGIATNIATVPPREASTLAIVSTAGAGNDVPTLEPLPQSSSTALVVADAPKPGFWSSLFGGAPTPPPDPDIGEANRAFIQSAQLREMLAGVHRVLPHDASILQVAPHRWEQLFTGYDTARASAIAMLSGLKTRLDTAARSGAAAALSAPSRTRFAEAASNVRSADAECASLRTAASKRHAEAGEAAAHAARVAAEKAAEEKAAMVHFNDDLKELTGPRRASLEERMSKLWTVFYRFGPPFIDDPAKNPNAVSMGLGALEVVPTLADKGSLVFGRANAYGQLYASVTRPIRSVAELEEVVSAYMGKGGND